MEVIVIILTCYVQSYETMAIDKFQMSRLTLDLSANVAHIVVPSTYIKMFFSETTRPIELRFHMTTPYDWLAEIYTNCDGHMTIMAIKIGEFQRLA